MLAGAAAGFRVGVPACPDGAIELGCVRFGFALNECCVPAGGVEKVNPCDMNGKKVWMEEEVARERRS